jgi:peptidoglycan/xylan/chitin deacetylase (PgdA/CDA1 family)
VKETVYSMTEAFGVNRLSAALHRYQPVILTFHGVTADSSNTICNEEGLHLHRSIFERLMEHLACHYRPVPLSRIVDWLEGRADAPESGVALTFDDGFRNVLTEAAPVLKRLGLPATLFVATDFVFKGEMLWPDRLVAAIALSNQPRLEVETDSGTRGFDISDRAGKLRARGTLTALCKMLPQSARLRLLDQIVERLGVDPAKLASAWDGFRPIQPNELKRLPEFGVTVGAHTCSHPILARLSGDEQAHELSESKRLIESATEVRCDEFAYPNGGPGDFSEQTRQRVIDAGYRCAFTTIKRRVVRSDDRFEIPRCTLTHNRISLAEFSAEVSGLPGAWRALRDRAASRTDVRDAAPRAAEPREGIA